MNKQVIKSHPTNKEYTRRGAFQYDPGGELPSASASASASASDTQKYG